jgi:hypothetical protein
VVAHLPRRPGCAGRMRVGHRWRCGCATLWPGREVVAPMEMLEDACPSTCACPTGASIKADEPPSAGS